MVADKRVDNQLALENSLDLFVILLTSVDHLDWLLQLFHVVCLLSLDVLFLSGHPDFKFVSLLIVSPRRDL